MGILQDIVPCLLSWQLDKHSTVRRCWVLCSLEINRMLFLNEARWGSCKHCFRTTVMRFVWHQTHACSNALVTLGEVTENPVENVSGRVVIGFGFIKSVESVLNYHEKNRYKTKAVANCFPRANENQATIVNGSFLNLFRQKNICSSNSHFGVILLTKW